MTTMSELKRAQQQQYNAQHPQEYLHFDDKSASDYDIKIVPNLLDELKSSTEINESTSMAIIEEIDKLHEQITVSTKTIGSEHPMVLQYLRDLVEKYIDINHYNHAERLLRRLEKAYLRTYGTTHIQYVYQSIRLADTLQWQIRYDESKEMYMRALHLFLNYYHLMSIEDLIGHEFVSPAVASARFLKTVEGQLRLQRRHKKQRKRDTLAMTQGGKISNNGVGTGVESWISSSIELKGDIEHGHRERSEGEKGVIVGDDSKQINSESKWDEMEMQMNMTMTRDSVNMAESKSKSDQDTQQDSRFKGHDFKEHIDTESKVPFSQQSSNLYDFKQQQQCEHKEHDVDADTGMESKEDEEDDENEDEEGEGMEEIDNVSLQSSIISLVSSTDGRASNIEERYQLLEQLLSGLALVSYQMRDYPSSESYYKQLLTLYYDILYPAHPYHLTILKTINYLSLVMEAVHQFDEASKICKQSYLDCELYYGKTHQLTLTAISTLARLLYTMKEIKESEETYLSAIERSLQTNGARHPMTIELRTSLAILYKETSRYEEAIAIVEHILLPQSEELFGKYDIHTLIIYDQIGELYSHLRGIAALPSSLSYYQQAYDGKVIFYHTSHHPEVYTSQFLLGQIYHRMCSWRHQSNYQEIREKTMFTLSSCYHGVMRLYPSLSYHTLCIDISLYFGQFLLQFNYFEEAKPIYLKLFDYFDQRLGLEKYILKPRNEHKRGSVEFLTRNSMIVSASGKDIVGLASSKPSSPDIFKGRSSLLMTTSTSEKRSAGDAGGGITSMEMNPDGSMSLLRLSLFDLEGDEEGESHNQGYIHGHSHNHSVMSNETAGSAMKMMPYSPFASKLFSANTVSGTATAGSVAMESIVQDDNMHWMSDLFHQPGTANTTASPSLFSSSMPIGPFSPTAGARQRQGSFLPPISGSAPWSPMAVTRSQSLMQPRSHSDGPPKSVMAMSNSRPPPRTPLPALSTKEDLLEMRARIESRGRRHLQDELEITTNRIMEITSISRAMSSQSSVRGEGSVSSIGSQRLSSAGKGTRGGTHHGATSTIKTTGGVVTTTVTLGSTRPLTNTVGSSHGGIGGKIKGNHMGICQGLTLNVRNIPTPPTATTSTSKRIGSPIKITTTTATADSYDALNAPTFPQTVEIDYSDHPITSIQIARKTKYEVHKTYTVPELLIYSDACYQLALLAERKRDYKQGYKYFTYAYVIYSILLDHPQFEKVMKKSQQSISERSVEKEHHEDADDEMDKGPTMTFTVSDGHRPDEDEIARATRSVISKMTTDESQSIFGSQQSGMITVPKIEDYDHKRIVMLKNDALEQVHHSEYLHLMCNHVET